MPAEPAIERRRALTLETRACNGDCQHQGRKGGFSSLLVRPVIPSVIIGSWVHRAARKSASELIVLDK